VHVGYYTVPTPAPEPMTADPTRDQVFAHAYERASYGDFAPTDAALPSLERSRDDVDRARAAALRAKRWMAAPAHTAPPDASALERFTGASRAARDAAALACAELARASALEFDPTPLASWCDLLDRLVHDSTHPALAAHRDVCRGWHALLTGDLANARALVEAAGQEATRHRVAAVVIEAAALRALVALETGELEEAVSTARRASRMARTEAIPQSEYLAHLVLARVRRATNHPHLATRILEALLRVASSSWSAWVRWELVFAGSRELAFPAIPADAGPRSWRAAVALARLFEAAERGVRPDFEARAHETLEHASGFRALEREVQVALSATDYRLGLSAELEAWGRGQSTDGAAAIRGLAVQELAGSEESATAFVVASPEGGARRILRSGRALLDIPGLAVLRQTRRKQGRVETLCAALALAGPDGIDESRCFELVYEFPYEPEMHKGVFDVLIHRAREYAGDAGSLERTKSRVHLTLKRPIVVPDPRCALPVHERLLRALAASHGATARDIAQTLGVSLRAAQAALQELANDGACLVERDGRRVEYRVEDTTFSEPTQVR
jgi:hypothetical protein